MTDQLELFTPPAAPPAPRFDADHILRGLPRNTPGTCCGHWWAQHDYTDAAPCRFCDCQQFSDAPVESPCCRTSPTGHCVHGRHDQCPYSPGGACYGGIITPECFVAMPPARGGWHGTDPKPDNFTMGAAAWPVIEPQHRIVCGCDCHLEVVGHA